jgi:hypothetical protein
MTDAPDGPAEGEAERAPRRSPRGGDSGSPVGSTLSIVLAVIAVIAGFLILRAITDDDDGGDAVTPESTPTAGSGASTVPGAGSVAVDPAATTTTAPPAPVKTGATVLVANASGVGGSAGAMSTALTTDGYTLAAEPTNSNLGAPLTASVVYYVDGDPAAQAVATTLGVTMGNVQVAPMPIPPPIDSELGTSTVLLMLGTDAAGKTLADLTAAPAVSPPAAVGTPTT